jgi:hypothetical protein
MRLGDLQVAEAGNNREIELARANAGQSISAMIYKLILLTNYNDNTEHQRYATCKDRKEVWKEIRFLMTHADKEASSHAITIVPITKDKACI